jgi:hypothetical protein
MRPANSGQSSKHVAMRLEHAKEAAVRRTPEQSDRRLRSQEQNMSGRAQKHIVRHLKHVCPVVVDQACMEEVSSTTILPLLTN